MKPGLKILSESVPPADILAFFRANFPESSKYEDSQLTDGFKVELEHAKTVNYDSKLVAQIVLDHLAEFPDYYTRLQKAGL